MRWAGQLAGVALLMASAAIAAASARASTAQTAASSGGSEALPAWDVVSIKPNQSNAMMIRVNMKPDGISMTGMPMHMILREAFGVTNDRLLGEPDWVNSERYDVEAKVAPEDAPKLKDLTPQERWEMLRAALEERCALKFHHETRELTVYALVVAKGGPKLQPAKPEDKTGEPGPGRGLGARSAGMSIGDKGMTMTGHGSSMAFIARTLSLQMGSTVVDKTGLTGIYDYTLQFAPDENMRGEMPSAVGLPGPDDAAGSQGPSIFTAVQEQLGLKLEARKEPVDVVVIDHMEKPTEN